MPKPKSKTVTWDYSDNTVLVIWSSEPSHREQEKERDRLNEAAAFHGLQIKTWHTFEEKYPLPPPAFYLKGYLER